MQGSSSFHCAVWLLLQTISNNAPSTLQHRRNQGQQQVPHLQLTAATTLCGVRPADAPASSGTARRTAGAAAPQMRLGATRSHSTPALVASVLNPTSCYF